MPRNSCLSITFCLLGLITNKNSLSRTKAVFELSPDQLYAYTDDRGGLKDKELCLSYKESGLQKVFKREEVGVIVVRRQEDAQFFYVLRGQWLSRFEMLSS